MGPRESANPLIKVIKVALLIPSNIAESLFIANQKIPNINNETAIIEHPIINNLFLPFSISY